MLYIRTYIHMHVYVHTYYVHVGLVSDPCNELLQGEYYLDLPRTRPNDVDLRRQGHDPLSAIVIGSADQHQLARVRSLDSVAFFGLGIRSLGFWFRFSLFICRGATFFVFFFFLLLFFPSRHTEISQVVGNRQR